jgi:RimJ/RimL family protein N-acetyltransferase
MQLVPIPRDGNVRLSDATLPEPTTAVIASTVQLYAQRGCIEPWVGYLAIEGNTCVGCCGFTAPPAGGVVEIAYFTFPDFEKRGVATRMAQGLLSIARECDPSVGIIAHTSTEENASNRILKKLSFAFIGTVDHPEDGKIWEWSYEQKGNQA